MKHYTIEWNDVKGNCPLPHYIKDGSKIAIEIDDDGVIQATGFCLFPKDDPTLVLRHQVNHFHSILLLGGVVYVVSALNTIWNAARAVALIKGWKNLISVKTETRVKHPIKIDKQYQFVATLKELKGNFREVKMKIVLDQIEYISVVTTVIVE